MARTDAGDPKVISRRRYALHSSREARHAGPFTLGGWSSGGLISFELARQLIASGDRVAQLLLIDTPCSHAMAQPSEDEMITWRRAS